MLLNADLTQSIGLAVHELATNAVKYGAWSNDKGLIRVEWSVSVDDGDRILSLVWQETGGPEQPRLCRRLQCPDGAMTSKPTNKF